MAKRHNIDAVHRHTSKQLTHLEKAIRRLYRKAATNAASVGAHYFNRYRSEWNAKLKQLKDGDITTTEWIQWATDTVFYGEDFARVSDELIALLSHTDADALALIDQIRTDVFVHAHNYTAYMIERTFYDTAFTLVDAHTLGVLQSTARPLLPVLTQNRKKYTQWMRQRIRNEVTAGITQGESIDKMAKRLANAANMSKSASVRTARTACTCAENTGRQQAYDEAAQQGLEMQKQWLCTVDKRTRETHATLDGETVRYDAKFSNGLRFPGDPQGKPGEVYNCRCTMVTVDPEGDIGTRRIQGEELPYMTFDDYITYKGVQAS